MRCCRHVTHRVLQERNLEGQTLLAIIEVNRWAEDQSGANAMNIFGQSEMKNMFLLLTSAHC